MEASPAAFDATRFRWPENTRPGGARRRRGSLSHRLRQLAVAIAPLVATVVVSAPAGAWPEIGG